MLPPALQVGADLAAALRHGDGGVVVIATPMAGLEPLLARLPPRLDAAVLWLCKGFQEPTGALGHEIARSVFASTRVGVLSGPSFAIEVARGQPTALVAASSDACVGAAAVAAFHHAGLRIYTSADPVGVEVGGAVKNVLAIATGIADGMGLGLNARAALVTRGLAEMTRLGVALGADARDLHGPVGPRRPGPHRDRRPVAQPHGRRRARAAARRSPTSSPTSATSPRAFAARRWCWPRAAASGVEMPIVAAVADVLAGRIGPEDALEQLMRREARAGVVRRGSDRSGVAVLAPGLEHRDRDGVAEVEAALAGAHRQAHRLRGVDRRPHRRRQARRFRAEDEPVAGARRRPRRGRDRRRS